MLNGAAGVYVHNDARIVMHRQENKMHLIHDIWHDSVFDTSTVHLLAINKLSQTKCCNKILEEKATLVKTELRLSQFSVPSASSDHSNAQPPHTEKLHFRNTRNTWERAQVRGEGSRVSSACIKQSQAVQQSSFFFF